MNTTTAQSLAKSKTRTTEIVACEIAWPSGSQRSHEGWNQLTNLLHVNDLVAWLKLHTHLRWLMPRMAGPRRDAFAFLRSFCCGRPSLAPRVSVPGHWREMMIFAPEVGVAKR